MIKSTKFGEKIMKNYHDRFCLTPQKIQLEQDIEQLKIMTTDSNDFETPTKAKMRKKNYSFELFDDSLNIAKIGGSLCKDDTFKKPLILQSSEKIDHKSELK
jgi:hypothetical protein